MSFLAPQDLVTIGLLVFLEGVLSIDNALALALIARRLPKHLQRRALTYGLVGAVLFRFLSLALVQYLMDWVWVKYIGGAYLVYMAVSHWLRKKPEEAEQSSKAGSMSFWKTVLVIELTDIAFAVDSILAAVALSPKLWIVVTGGVLGIVMMRFAANVFIRLLEKFPNFELTAYLLVFLVGAKLIFDGLKIPGINFHSSESPAFWIFWAAVVIAFGLGFMKRKPSAQPSSQKTGR